MICVPESQGNETGLHASLPSSMRGTAGARDDLEVEPRKENRSSQLYRDVLLALLYQVGGCGC